MKGEAAWPRVEFLYWTDDGNAAAPRLRQWKISFLRQDAHGLAVWQMPFLPLRAPMICNLRADPLERAEYEGMDYNRWFIEHAFAMRLPRCMSGAGCKVSVNSAAPETGQFQS